MTLRRTLFFWWAAAFLILAAIFISGSLKPQALPSLAGDYPSRPVNARPHFDRNSEVLVENAIDARLAGAGRTPGGYMFRIPGDPRVLDVNNPAAYQPDWRPGQSDFDRRQVYSSQLGLQGRVYAAAAQTLGLSRASAIEFLRRLTAAALAAMLALILILIRREWGRLAALSAFAFCVVSTGFNLFAPSLYWITFAHVAPAAAMSAALLLGARTRLHWSLMYLSLFVLFAIKFLSGFEFLTVTIAAAASPLFIVFAAGRLSPRHLIIRSALVLATGLAAFLAALVIYHFHHQSFLGQSGLSHLLSRGESWVAPADRGLLEQARQFMKVLLVNMVDYNGYGIPTGIPFAAGVTSLFLGARVLVRKSLDNPASRIMLSVAGAFLVSISWMVLQAEHVAFHPRYATILLAFPFGLFLAAGVARMVEVSLARSARAADLNEIAAS